MLDYQPPLTILQKKALVTVLALGTWSIFGAGVLFPSPQARAATSAPARKKTPGRQFRAAQVTALNDKGIVTAELGLQLAAAIAEAAEVLGVIDGLDDTSCVLDLRLKLPIQRIPWQKRPAMGAVNDEEALINSSTVDVDTRDDYDNVRDFPGDIKVVGKISVCLDKEGRDKGKLQVLACAFPAGKGFMVSRDVLNKLMVRGVVVAHEHGHNAGIDHVLSVDQVLYEKAAEFPLVSRQVTPEQCVLYKKWTIEKDSAPQGGRGASISKKR